MAGNERLKEHPTTDGKTVWGPDKRLPDSPKHHLVMGPLAKDCWVNGQYVPAGTEVLHRRGESGYEPVSDNQIANFYERVREASIPRKALFWKTNSRGKID